MPKPELPEGVADIIRAAILEVLDSYEQSSWTINDGIPDAGDRLKELGLLIDVDVEKLAWELYDERP